MWRFNGEDDATRCGRKGPDSAVALAKQLSDLFKREEEEFIRIKPRDGFSMYNPPSWVSCYLLFQSFPHSSSQIFTLPIHSRNCEKLREVHSLSPHTEDPDRALDPDLKKIQTYL